MVSLNHVPQKQLLLSRPDRWLGETIHLRIVHYCPHPCVHARFDGYACVNLYRHSQSFFQDTDLALNIVMQLKARFVVHVICCYAML